MVLGIVSIILGFFGFIVSFSKITLSSLIYSMNLEFYFTIKFIVIAIYVIVGIVLSIIFIIYLQRIRKEKTNGLVTSSFVISIINLVLLVLEIFVFIMMLYAADQVGSMAAINVFNIFNKIIKISGFLFITIGILVILNDKNILSKNSISKVKEPKQQKEKVNNKNDEKLINLYIDDLEGYEKLVKAGIIEKDQDERIRELAISKKEEKEKRSITNLYQNDKKLFLDMVEIDFFSEEEIKSFEEEMDKTLSEVVEELKAEK